MQQNTTTTPTRAHGSGSMILQPEDVVALTADEAAADIEDAMRAFTNENGNDKEQGRRPSHGRE